MNTQKIDWKFTGRYAHTCENLANRAMSIFSCSESNARRLANAFAADYGKRKFTTKEDGITLRFGKLDKDGNISITEVESMISKGLATPALSIANAVFLLDKAISLKNGMVWDECTIQLIPSLHKWLFEIKDSEQLESEHLETLVKA